LPLLLALCFWNRYHDSVDGKYLNIRYGTYHDGAAIEVFLMDYRATLAHPLGAGIRDWELEPPSSI